MFDVVIKNGTIIDGTGRPAFTGDIGIKRGLIDEVGELGGAQAKETVDASGSYIAPGFIDITNHSDVTAAIFDAPQLQSLVRQGITTIIGGNCGISLAPLTSPDIIHGIRKWASTSAINVNWTSVAEFLDEVKKRALPVNFGTLVGHGTLRRGVTHEEMRRMTLEENAQFLLLLREALADGALGLSSNFGSAHENDANAGEFEQIMKTLAAAGGIYKPHLRDEGVNLLPSLNEALRMGAEAKVPLAISHLKAAGRQAWPSMRKGLKMLERAAEDGRKVLFDVTPYLTTNSQLYMMLPAWVRDSGFSAMLKRFDDNEMYIRVIEDLTARSLHYNRIRVSEAGDWVSPGRTIAQIAETMGASGEAAVVELLRANRGRVTVIAASLHRENVERQLAHPLAAIATNGSGFNFGHRYASVPHPRSFGTYPHFLHKYVREKKLLTWEDAVRKITSLPSDFIGLRGRGRLMKNYAADIVVFNPRTIRDQATYQNPFVPPTGIGFVFVNGAAVVRNGETTDARPGAIVKRA